jgi:uncharacterized protein (DUF1778 family)
LRRAARKKCTWLQGATLHQFVGQSAYQEAQRILVRETVIRLSQRDAQKAFSLLDQQPKANKRLNEAVIAYRATVRA